MNIHPITLQSVNDEYKEPFIVESQQNFNISQKTKNIKYLKKMKSPKIFQAIEPKEANIGLRNKSFINPQNLVKNSLKAKQI